MHSPAGIVALAVDYPGTLRTNDYWRLGHPAAVADAESRALARFWVPDAAETRAAARIFDEELAPYLKDPFRGAVERRALSPGETVLSVEARAARKALDAARMSAKDVDLLISAAFVTDHPGIGQAAFLAKELGVGGTAWNLETACASGLEAVRTAAGLVRAGEHRCVLVVVSCMYSKVSDPEDSITWTVGDGAAAFVVAEHPSAAPILGAKARHTGETCGAMFFERGAGDALVMRSSREGGRSLREASAASLVACCEGALAAAGRRLAEVDFCIFNTPVAWYAKFCARALGVPPERTVDTFPTLGNMGPVLLPANLYEAARAGRLHEGDTVLAYAIGSVSSVGAMVLEWNDVALGAPTEPPTRRE